METQGGWSPGSRVGDYELLHRLGGGGMGQVHAARHLATGAEVAIKTLTHADPELLLRFQREAEAQARVDGHPHVARIHTYGVHSGWPYLVMDLLPGGDLQQRLEQTPLAPREAARLIATLARALAHCHAQGVLHRDLKPANVLFDAEDRPLLVDFGLASLQDATTLTQTGTLLGTPSYMAPEQAIGKPSELGPATDVYGLGAVLYACLAGQPPHGVGRGHLATLQAVLNAIPAAPSTHRPGIPAALDRICLDALAKDPTQRPTVEALAERLEAWAAADVPDDRTRALAWIGLGALLAGGLAAGLALSATPTARPTPTQAPTPPPTPPPVSLGASPTPAGPTEAEPLLAEPLRRLLADPAGELRALLERDDAPPEELAAALLLAAPPPGFRATDRPPEHDPALLALADSWLAGPDLLPPDSRASLVASASLYVGDPITLMALEKGEGSGSGDDPPLLRLEGALFAATVAVQRRHWASLEASGTGSVQRQLEHAAAEVANEPAPLAFAALARAQGVLYEIYRRWWLERASHLPPRRKEALLAFATGLQPATPGATHLRALAAIHEAYRAHDDFARPPTRGEDPVLARLTDLPDTPSDRFLAAALHALLAPDATPADRERTLVLAQALPPRCGPWPSALLKRLVEGWIGDATLRAWRGEQGALDPFLDLDRPDLFVDPRPMAVLRAESLLLARGRDPAEAFVAEGADSAWWPELPYADDLYDDWRTLVGVEVAFQRPHGDLAVLLSNALPKERDPALVEDPLERAFHVHARHIRRLLDALGQSPGADLPLVPPPPDLGAAAPYLPVWRSPEHTRRAIEAMRHGRWRPWHEPGRPGPRPER